MASNLLVSLSFFFSSYVERRERTAAVVTALVVMAGAIILDYPKRLEKDGVPSLTTEREKKKRSSGAPDALVSINKRQKSGEQEELRHLSLLFFSLYSVSLVRGLPTKTIFFSLLLPPTAAKCPNPVIVLVVVVDVSLPLLLLFFFRSRHPT